MSIRNKALDAQLAAAIHQLKGDARFDKLVDAMKQVTDRKLDQCAKEVEYVALCRAQGAYQALNEFVEFIEHARSYLHSANTPDSHTGLTGIE